MPIPIMPIQNSSGGQSTSTFIDYSFLFNDTNSTMKKSSRLVSASNKDAELLFKIWKKGEKQEEIDTFKVKSSVSAQEVMRLKTYGFLTGSSEEVMFTSKGKTVIKTMVLSEPNSFEVKRQAKPYNEILAEMSKKGKPGYRIPKYAANTSNNLNLRDI